MFYVLMVSHGEFAPGLHTAVKMIAGDRDTVLSTSLKDGMGADEYAANVEKLVANITPEDKLVVLELNKLTESEFLEKEDEHSKLLDLVIDDL